MNFIRLSELIADIKNRPQPESEDLIEKAVLMHITYYPQAPMGMLNIITMALLMDRLKVHEISPGAVNAIQGVDIQAMPESPPALLRLPWLIESRDLNRSLFGDTVCLGGYFTRGKFFLIGIQYPDGVRAEAWEPDWGKDIKIPLTWTPFAEPEMGHTREEWAKQAAKFSLALGLLLEAEKTPVVVKKSETGRKKRNGSRGRSMQEWSVHRVVLGKTAIKYYGSSRPAGQNLDKVDKILARTVVSGHLRYQPHGPGRESRKWIWIDAYESHRWTKPKARIRVDIDSK